MIARSEGPLRRSGLTLLEVVVSSALLALLVLVISAAVVPVNRVSKDSMVSLDMERTGRRVMAELRRELRQSGSSADGKRRWVIGETTVPSTTDPLLLLSEIETPLVGSTADINTGASMNLLAFQTRKDLHAANEDENWTTTVVLKAVKVGIFKNTPGAINRFRLVRAADLNGDGTVQSSEEVTVAHGVSKFRVEEFGDGLQVLLQLTEPNPIWIGGVVPTPYQKTFEDTIELLNKNNN